MATRSTAQRTRLRPRLWTLSALGSSVEVTSVLGALARESWTQGMKKELVLTRHETRFPCPARSRGSGSYRKSILSPFWEDCGLSA